ncbi:MAG: hypothetical protein NWE87_00170 [Candidatus Bathyarchaeota archaeon]|nr:hypothetical protein [Candidatus Bathyarchaeota archaeon]
MSIPSWAQSDGDGPDLLGEKSEEVVIREDNPFPIALLVTIISIVADIATTGWNIGREKERAKIDEEKIRRYETELETLQSDLENTIQELKKAIQKELTEVETLLMNKLREEKYFRKQADTQHSDQITTLRNDIDRLAELQDMLPTLKKVRDEAQKLLPQMEDMLERFVVVEKELKGEIESLKTANAEQLEMIGDLREKVTNLRTKTIPQKIDDAKKTLRAELNEEVESRKTADAQQTTKIENLERRRIEFGLAVGAWFPKSNKKAIAACEGQLLIGSDVTLFAGGGWDDSWITYYGVKYTFADILSLGVGGLNSTILEKTELMYLGGLSHDIGKVRLSVDYLYLPEEEDASGTRACIAVRF